MTPATPSTNTTRGALAFNDHQIAELAKRGLAPETIRAGAVSVATELDLPDDAPTYWTVANGILPAILFPWRSPITGEVEWQARPDTPVVKPNGDTAKYVFRKRAASVLHDARGYGLGQDLGGVHPLSVLITEGTCQTDVAALHAPDGVAVYGIAGCQSWMKTGVVTSDLAVVDGQAVLIVLDTDAGSNRDVFDAGVKLREAALAEGAISVRFVRVPGGNRAGLDDYLAGRGGADRAATTLANLMESARTDPKAMEKPADRRPDAKPATILDEDGNPVGPARFFDPNSGGLLVKTLSEAIRSTHPSALTAEQKVAVYQNGVYGIDGAAFLSVVGGLLGERYANGHLNNVESFTIGALHGEGRYLPERVSAPVLNLANGMLDLRTGQLTPHGPESMSTAQLPVEWDPQAQCPTYDAWLKLCDVESQVADMEEATAAMLDPSTTPARAVFLFGPSKSGKSTWLRIMMAMAGQRNTSGVSLHQLVENKFMAANVYGKILNVSADLSAAHVEDISIFKMMTGEDLIMADRKYGGQFSFTNRALFAFSANELPTVGESSRAYSERIKPFHFARTFAGHEDPSMERTMLDEELPGILVRWVRAWQRRQERGAALVTDPAVRARFEEASDRVRQFVSARYAIGTPEAFATTAEIHLAFREWCQDEGRTVMGRTKMAARLETIPGVEAIRNSATKARGWNVALLPRSQWDEDKTDMASGEADKSVTVVAELAELTPSSRATGKEVFIVDHERKQNLLSGHNGLNSANSATEHETAHLRAVATESDNQADMILTEHSLNRYVSRCPDCGSEEALVDGLWFACPACHPKTVR